MTLSQVKHLNDNTTLSIWVSVLFDPSRHVSCLYFGFPSAQWSWTPRIGTQNMFTVSTVRVQQLLGVGMCI